MDTPTFQSSSGSDGILTISSNTTETVVDSASTGTSGTDSLSATNAGFAADQLILIHQTQGSGAGSFEFNFIESYVAGTITTVFNLQNTYGTGAQVRKVPQYTAVTVQSGFTYTGKAWNGTTGGLLTFICQGFTNVAGTIDVSEKGFRGGNGRASAGTSQAGEGTAGPATESLSPNGNGGGGNADPADGGGYGAGCGGSNATLGEVGQGQGTYTAGQAGSVVGNADMSTLNLGGGGGGNAVVGSGVTPGNGGRGGGICIIFTGELVVTGFIKANGGRGTQGDQGGTPLGMGASGSGGVVWIETSSATIGVNLIQANGGARGDANDNGTVYGGFGGNGYVTINSCNRVGTTNQGSVTYNDGGHDFCQAFIHIYG
jgi:large repetitive protein